MSHVTEYLHIPGLTDKSLANLDNSCNDIGLAWPHNDKSYNNNRHIWAAPMQIYSLRSKMLTVAISSDGAEMHSIKDAAGNEYLWQADSSVWGRHAPHLFPIVGRLQNDTLIYKGNKYPMSQHGFARDNVFALENHNDRECSLLLKDNEDTFKQYPFNFELRIHYSLDNNKLKIVYDIMNSGQEVLPCSVGAHPAFNWPLPGSPGRDQHSIVFSMKETCTMKRLDSGLIKSEAFSWPVRDQTLELEDSLFEDDAMILTEHQSRQVTLQSPGKAAVTVSFADFPHLGIWSKPAAGFVCIEPWQGHSDPLEFNGEFPDKPGVVHIAPGQSRQWEMAITITPA